MFILILFFLYSSNASAALPVKILLVPGHDNEVWGAQYGNIKEADMNLRLAQGLYKILSKDKRFKVYITRDNLGYTTEFANYFGEHYNEIAAFRTEARARTEAERASGNFIPVENVPHNNVTTDVANMLYGINKWSNENNIDAVIHIHFNDYPRASKWTKGEYKGFAIYYPQSQLKNSLNTFPLAQNIWTEMKKKYVTSTYPPEGGGLIPDLALIALGSNNTLNETVRSVLIEYGYIYRFSNKTFRHKAYKDTAARTATGLKNYFFPK